MTITIPAAEESHIGTDWIDEDAARSALDWFAREFVARRHPGADVETGESTMPGPTVDGEASEDVSDDVQDAFEAFCSAPWVPGEREDSTANRTMLRRALPD